MKGGRGTLKVLRNTTIIHPADETVSADVTAGQELSILAWKQEKDKFIFTLEEETIAGKNTWQIPCFNCSISTANPEIDDSHRVGVIDLVELPRLGRIDLKDSIIQCGNFTWAEATHSGTRMPPNEATLDAIIRIATLAQEARNKLGREMTVTSWYRTLKANTACGGAKKSRHLIGDAMDFTCEGLSGKQLYKFLDPWWPGGLGQYKNFLNLCHIDARGYKARWGLE